MRLATTPRPTRSAVPALALTLATLFTVPAAAQADGVVISQHVFTSDGQPSLVANYSPDGSLATPQWKICNPDCGPVVATSNVLNPGETAAGTTFEASATPSGGATTTARSRQWLGRVTSTAAPTFTGTPVVGSTLTPSAGTWSGGWGNDFSWLGMRACRTADGQDCHAMDSAPLGQNVTTPLVIDAAYVGWYIGAVETRLAAETAIAGVGLPQATPGKIYPIASPAPGQTVAVSPLVGPVAGLPAATDDPDKDSTTITPVFTSRLALRKKALVKGSLLSLGTIRCSSRCVAHVTVKAGGKTVKHRLVVKNAKAITVKRKLLPARASLARLTVTFDGHRGKKSGRLKLR
jgi:hypothetical protein